MRHRAVILLLLVAVHAAATRDLSIQELVASPAVFNGKRVSVIGYFVAAHEECCLYTSRKARQDLRRPDFNIAHVIWIEFVGRANEMVLNNRYGRFTGRFRYRAVPKDQLSGFGQWGYFLVSWR